MFSGNQGIAGGAINIVVAAYIGHSSIVNNSADFGGGIYSQGIITLDHVEVR